MSTETQVIVLKFGSSVLRSEDDLPAVVHEIYRWWRTGHHVVAVVSAFGNTTDDLTRRAHNVCDQPEDALVAALLATGETASSALLGLALNRSGLPATVLDAEQAGLLTVGDTLDADLVAVDAASLLGALQEGIVVLPGFVGRTQGGQTTLLGRGGSDLTALFLAQRLGGDCRLVKDVDGLYTSDPNARTGVAASRFAEVSYRTARKVGGAVVQLKAIDFAEKHRLRFSVSSVGLDRVTEVGPFVDRIDVGESLGRPLRVALLGCGTVGGGVYKRLAALPELFEVVGVATRNVDRAIDEDVPVRLITTHLDRLISESPDVVVELLGGIEPALSLVTKALLHGCHVVTANKALLANHLSELESIAGAKRSRLLYSAAVGGVVPTLETVRRAREYGELSVVSGILNGTTNFILDELANGIPFSTALHHAQQLGYAEANPQFDLDGTDAAQKLILLAREAFDVELAFDSIRRVGIDESTATPGESGKTIRVVAQCRRTKDGFEASVTPVELSQDHPLADVRGASNRLLVEDENGRTWTVSGRGAGRWPTTEAVIADLFDLSGASTATTLEEEEECVA